MLGLLRIVEAEKRAEAAPTIQPRGRNPSLAASASSQNQRLPLELIGIILGLVAWINQAYIAEQWRWWTITRP